MNVVDVELEVSGGGTSAAAFATGIGEGEVLVRGSDRMRERGLWADVVNDAAADDHAYTLVVESWLVLSAKNEANEFQVIKRAHFS